LAERSWAHHLDWVASSDTTKADSLFRNAWARFVNTVGKRELPRLDREMAGLNYRIPTPGLKSAGGLVYTSVEVPGFTLRYTTDGNEPTVRSAVVNGPISARGTVRVAAFNASGRKGNTASLALP